MENLRKARGKNRGITDALFLLFFAAATALLLRKAPYGFHFFDEANWLVLPRRLLRGDALGVDDWSFTQFSLLPLYPLMKLYSLFFTGTEGIILRFRYIFIVFHALVALCVYGLLRKNSPEKALCAAAIYYLYSHLYIQALSYYQMSLDFVLLCALLLTKEKRAYFAAGLLFAPAVLTCPYLGVLYFLYALACLLTALRGKAEKNSLLSGGNLARFTLGCAVPAAVFLGFVLSRSTLRELIAAFPHYFGDQAHEIGGAGKKLLRLFPDLAGMLTPADLPLLLTLAAVILDKKRAERKVLYALCLAAAGLCSVIAFYFGSFAGGILTLGRGLMKAPVLAGAAAYRLCEKRDREVFRFVWLGGFVLLICLYIASDTGVSVCNTALCVSAAAGGCFIVQLTSELLPEGKKGRAAALLCLVLLLSQIFAELMLRKNYCFSEPAGVSMMTETIDYGIGKGERTTELVKKYEQDGLWEATEKVRNAKGDYVVYFSDDCWPYLEDSKACGAFTAWIQQRSAENEAERLLDYWELHPEKKPDAIYVSKHMSGAESIVNRINTENFPVEENERGYVMIRGEG